MALAAVEPKNLLQKIRRLILGKEKPNFLTRVSCGVGFVVWVYLVSWHILTFIALLLYPTLNSTTAQASTLIQSNFVRVGGRYSMGDDPINDLIGHAGVQIVLFMVMLVGLILIYRKKKIGFLLYVFAGLATPLVTLLLLGYLYMSAEISIGDSLLLGASIAYFGIGALIFYRKKKEPEESKA